MKTKASPAAASSRWCPDIPRELNKYSIKRAITNYTSKVDVLRLGPIARLEGRRLLQELKRAEIGDGPGPEVSWFEAANRILTDLVILYGVRWMLHQKQLPFKSYHVQLGNEQKKPFDIMAHSDKQRLVGEAFSVAQSFFPEKMRKTRLKLSKPGELASHKVIIFNADRKDKLTPRDGDPAFVVVELDGTCDLLSAGSWSSPPKRN
jgi:hypothetical protein